MLNSSQVAIVGGGMAGLSAAWHLQQRGVAYTVLEASPRLGGMVRTEALEGCDGFVADGGPESFITRKPELWQLAQALGLQDQIVPIASETRGTCILTHGKPLPVPLGPGAFITSPLLSVRGKLRLLMEPFVAPKHDDDDESLAAFTRRRLGDEALQKLVGPILAGIYSTNPEQQSVQTTASILRDLEAHGSLLKGMLAQGKARSALKKTGQALPPRSFTFKNGAQTIVDSLAQQLTGAVHLDTAVVGLMTHDAGYALRLSNGATHPASALILATQANVAAPLLAHIAPQAANALQRIRHESIGTLALAFREADARAALGITGLMVPRREGRQIDAVVWRGAHNRAPQGHVLLRVFFGGNAPGLLDLDDAALLDVVRSELKDIVGIVVPPLAARIFRWRGCFPKPDVHHLKLVREIEAGLPQTIALAGNSYGGVGVPDCVRSGFAAADRILARIPAK
jgi:protoporphyrinogen/coproporphyrinogen III oxidase